jgi:hypothetical protein
LLKEAKDMANHIGRMTSIEPFPVNGIRKTFGYPGVSDGMLLMPSASVALSTGS